MANPNPIFPHLGAAGRPKKPNALVLTVGLIIRMQPLPTEAPLAYLKRLFDACFTQAELAKQFPTAVAMATAAQAGLPLQFDLAAPKDAADQQLLAALNAANPAQPEAAATALRDLVRGYTDARVPLEEAAVKKSIAERSKQVAAYRVESEKRRAAADKKAQNALRDQYRENRDALDQIAADLAGVDATAVAHENLRRDAGMRRYKPLFAADLISADTFLDLRISGLDPDLVDFPLRHLMSISLKAHHELVDRWKQDRDKAKLILPLEGEIRHADFFDSIDRMAAMQCFGFDQARLDVFKELREVVMQGRMQSAALIAVTQTEGLLWAYAHHLQITGTPVYKLFPTAKKTKHAIYQWNPKTQTYRTKYKNGRPKHKTRTDGTPIFATSGRDLVTESVLQQATSAEIYTYLLDQFFDERNDLAHGNLVVDKLLVLQALLCLHSMLQHLVDHANGDLPVRFR